MYAQRMKCLWLFVLLGTANAFSSGRVALFSRKNNSILWSKPLNQDTAASATTVVNGAVDLESDSVDRYEQDVTTVIKAIHPHEVDQTIPSVYRSRRLSFTNIWTLEEWRLHTSRWRYLSSLTTFPVSRLFRRVFPQLSVITLWTALVVTQGRRVPFFRHMHVPFSSLSVISGFVAALQTLRSNQGLSRLGEGRVAMGNAVLLTRDSAHLFARHIYRKDKELGLMAARHLSLFCWLLKAHLRDVPEDDVMKTMLPTRSDQDYVESQRKKPVALVARLRQVIAAAREKEIISMAQELRLEENVKGLEHVIMTTERIRGSPIPPVYSSNAAGLMLIYLLTLPLALVGTDLSPIATLCFTGSVGYAMLGLDEVSHMLEQPFRLMPLYQLSKVSMTDVADAFVCPPPSLASRALDELTVAKKPTYW